MRGKRAEQCSRLPTAGHFPSLPDDADDDDKDDGDEDYDDDEEDGKVMITRMVSNVMNIRDRVQTT